MESSKKTSGGKAGPAKKKKRSHAPSAYNLFVKKHYDSVRSIKRPQDRMRELGKRWRAHKKKNAPVSK